jgi:hypothetical protein
MGRLSDATMNAMLDLMFGTGHAGIFPASYDVALSTTAPTNAGTNVTEPSGNAYARVSVPNDDAHWPPAVSRQKSNGTAITFPQPTGSWGTVTHFAIYDGGTSTFRAWGALQTPRSIDATSDPPTFAISALVVNGPGS